MKDQALTLTPVKTIELAEADASKIEMIELELSDLTAELATAVEDNNAAIGELMQLAKAAQNDKIYSALAALIQANNGTNRERLAAIKEKRAVIESRKEASEPEAPVHQTINNTLITTTEMIDAIRNRNNISTDE